MSELVSQQSPIPWPSSKKKNRLKSLTPSVREGNKLSSKKKNKLPNSQVSTPTSTPKQLLIRKKSLETFNRVYNEIFYNSFSGNESTGIASPSNCPETRYSSLFSTNAQISPSILGVSNKPRSETVVADVVGKRTDGGTSSQNLKSIENLPLQRKSSGSEKKKSLSSDVIVVDSDSSWAGTSFATGSPIVIDSPLVTGHTFKTPQSSKLDAIIFETSSDDDSIRVLPLHQRISKTPIFAPAKTKSGKKTYRASPLLDNSSDNENSPVVRNQTRRKLGKPTVLFNESSSEDEFPDLPRPQQPTPCSKTPKIRTTSIFEKKTSKYDSSSEDELPDLPRPQQPTIKSSKIQTTSIFEKKPSKCDSSSDYELSDLPRPQQPTTKSCKVQTTSIFENKTSKYDSSSDDELPDLARRIKPTTTSVFDKKAAYVDCDNSLPSGTSVSTPITSAPRYKPFLTVPRKLPRQPAASVDSPTIPSGPTGNAGLKQWTTKESLTDSSEFLKSLSQSSPVEIVSAQFRKQFAKNKDLLVQKLYALFNQTVFENQLPVEMSITWNIRLTKTAGYCYMKTHSDKKRTARIELSTKVLDNAERVRDTLLHEMCHAAAFLVHGYQDGHGPIFQHWGRKACFLFPYLPVVSKCHNYTINTKYVYKCTRCSATIGRHSKSLDTNRKGCGRCGGRFELLVNGSKTPTSNKKKTPEFAKFVKQNYKSCKEANQNLKHAEIMHKLGQDFACKATI